MFPHLVSVKLTKSKVEERGGAGFIPSGLLVILTCSFRWLGGHSKAGGGARLLGTHCSYYGFDPEGIQQKATDTTMLTTNQFLSSELWLWLAWNKHSPHFNIRHTLMCAAHVHNIYISSFYKYLRKLSFNFYNI